MNQLDLIEARGLEVRYLASSSAPAAIEIRTDGNGLPEFLGYACAYDFEYNVAGGPEAGGWVEVFTPGSATRTLNSKPDVRMLVDHGGTPIARTKSGTLLIDQDTRGLIGHAPALDMRNPKVQEVNSAMDRGDVDEMSFAFQVTRQDWNKDFTHRTIREFSLDVNGSDLSIVTFPASKATVAMMRTASKVTELRSNAPGQGMSLSTARAIAAQISVHR